MSAAREQEAARLHEAFDDFKRKMESRLLAASANSDCGASAVDRNFQGCSAI
jgi:hypothetical protein